MSTIFNFLADQSFNQLTQNCLYKKLNRFFSLNYHVSFGVFISSSASQQCNAIDMNMSTGWFITHRSLLSKVSCFIFSSSLAIQV